jgi:small-conductance mechanosensitive channel
VAQGNDPNRVREILERTAAAHPLVAKEPPPQALVTKLGPDSITFELRAWTDRGDQWMQIRSELAIAVNAALTAEKIAMK